MKLLQYSHLLYPSICNIFPDDNTDSGYFRIRNFFFPDTATVHTHPANSTANPEKK